MHAQFRHQPPRLPTALQAARPVAHSIRRAGCADIAALAALLREGDAGPHAAANADSFEPAADELHVDAGSDILLADGADGPLGFVQLRWGAPPPSREWMRDSVELKQQYVHTRHRGTGMAASLLDIALRLVRQRGMHGIWLKVGKDAPAAIGFYLKCGFRIVGTAICTDVRSPRETWVMHRRIAEARSNGLFANA